jgi:hypothetical protein
MTKKFALLANGRVFMDMNTRKRFGNPLGTPSLTRKKEKIQEKKELDHLTRVVQNFFPDQPIIVGSVGTGILHPDEENRSYGILFQPKKMGEKGRMIITNPFWIQIHSTQIIWVM